MPMKQRKIAARGFTMIELTLALVLMSIVAVGTAPLLLQAINSYSITTSHSRTVHDVRTAMKQMMSETLLVRTVDIQGIQATQFDFVDAQSNATNYRYLAGNPGSILRGNTLLSPNITNLTFTYLDANGTPTNQIPLVRRIDIAITGVTATQGTVALRAEVFPRNFMYANFQ